MRKNFGVKPWGYPQPVWIIASYDENGTADAMNAAWGGVSDANRLAMCLSAGHKTVHNILAKGAFTVSMATVDFTAQCDYVGIVSANRVPDKLERCGLHTRHAEFVDAPLIEELPMTVECRLISYEKGTGILQGEIVNVSAEDSVLTNGSIDPAKLKPITFDPVNNQYLCLGGVVGRAFHDGAVFQKRGEKG